MKAKPTESPVDSKIESQLPLEPMRSLEVAAELIPFSTVNALLQFLYHNRTLFPSRYIGGYRMLYDSEIIKIRQIRIEEGENGFYNSQAFKTARRGRKRAGFVDSIIKRAMQYA